MGDDPKTILLEVAKKHFAEFGFDGASVREMCQEAGVNISSVKYYFGDKEGLYKACLVDFGEKRLETISKILTNANSLDELKLRLTLFIEDFIRTGFENEHVIRMVCRELETENPIFTEVFEGSFLKSYLQLQKLFEEAQDKGFIKEEIDVTVLTSLFYHGITQSIRLDKISCKYFCKTLKDDIHRKQLIENYIKIFFEGIKNED